MTMTVNEHEESHKKKRNLLVTLTFVACMMFGFGYAMVPLYDLFCEVTGFGGRTETISADEAKLLEIDPNRTVRVQFTSHASTGLPWDFGAEIKQAELKPGQVYEFYYLVKNESDREITAQSTFNVTPPQAGGHLKKLDCFCFTQQTLVAKEERRMLVRLMVDPELPNSISELTLGYSFFKAKEPKT